MFWGFVRCIVVCHVGVLLVACGAGDSGGGSSGFSVRSTLPANGASEVAVNSKIQVTFSDDVDQTSLNSYTFQVMESEGMSLIEGKIQYDAGTRTVTFEPYMPLTYETPLHVMISDKIRNAAGTHLSATSNILFETVGNSTESTFDPADGSANVSPGTSIRVQFGQGINMFSIDTSNITLVETTTSASVELEIEIDEDANTAILYVSDNYNNGNGLKSGTQYTYTVTTGVLNSSGGPFFNANQSKTFTTAMSTPFTNVIGSIWDEYADAIAIASDGTLIVAGETWGALTDSVEHYDGDGFIAAIDPNSGELLDVLQFGSGSPTNWNLELADPVYDMTMIGNDIYVTGFTTGNFQPGDSTPGPRKMFLAKYTWNGTNVMASGIQPAIISASADLEGYAIAKDSTSIYVVGTTMGAANGETNKGEEDVVVAKFDTNLTQQWVKQYGTRARDFGRGITVDGAFVYVAGDTLGDFATPDIPHVGLNPFLLQINASDGSQGTATFDTSSASANPSNAFDRMTTGVASNNGTIYLVGTQRNANGTSAFALTYSASGGTPTYAAHGENTLTEDERATGIYVSPSGSVYVAVTRFHMMNTNGSMMMHGMTEIQNLNGTAFSQYKTLDAGMHASVRSMVMDNFGTMFATGYVHGSMDGVMPIGMGDAFVVKP